MPSIAAACRARVIAIGPQPPFEPQVNQYESEFTSLRLHGHWTSLPTSAEAQPIASGQSGALEQQL